VLKEVAKLDDEEYAIVSKKEFLALKKEIDRLKKNPLEGSDAGENLQASIDNLSKGLNVMLEVFKQAADDMKLEEHDSDTLAKQMGPINEKIDTLIEQNQKIAKGIVAVADMVKEKLEEINESQKNRLPPLRGGPAPSSQPFPPQPPRMPSAQRNDFPPLGPPGFEDDAPPDLPPLTPPGGFSQTPSWPSPKSQNKRDVMSGLMK
jgi:hypothetical protein